MRINLKTKPRDEKVTQLITDFVKVMRTPEGSKTPTKLLDNLGLKGSKGDKGEPGITPQKNIDYFDGEDGLPGESITGPVGPQGPKPSEEELISLIEPLIPEPIKGDPGKDGVDGINPDPVEVIELLKNLPEEKKLDISHIRNSAQLLKGLGKKGSGYKLEDQRWHGAGLSAVIHDASLTGEGTIDSPLATVDAGGDVVGPASAIGDRVVLFNGATGKLIKDSGLTLAGSNTGDQTITLSGDISGTGTGAITTTLPTVNANVGSFTNASLTVNAKGLVTAASSGTAPVTISTTVALTGQNLDITDTAFAVNTAGLYRIAFYLVDTVADITAGAVTLHIKFTDGGGARDIASAPVVLSALTGFAQGVIIVQLASGNCTYGVTHSGVFGSSQFALYLAQEKLQ